MEQDFNGIMYSIMIQTQTHFISVRADLFACCYPTAGGRRNSVFAN